MAWQSPESGGSLDRLSALPEDVLLCVCRLLTPHDMLSLRHANRSLRSCVGPTFFSGRPVKFSLWNANPVLDAFVPGTLTAGSVDVRGGHSASSIAATAADALPSSPHVPCLLDVELAASSDENVGAAKRDVHAFVRRLRDIESLVALVDLLPLASSTSSAALGTASQEPVGLSHLSRLKRLELQCYVSSQAGLVTMLQLVSELPSLRTLVMESPEVGRSGTGHLPVDAMSPTRGRHVGDLCLEEVELRYQIYLDCDLKAFSGMQFLRRLSLHTRSVRLDRSTELDLPRVEGVFMTTLTSAVIPLLNLPSLRTLHVVHGGDFALVGRLSDAPNLESIVLTPKCLHNVPDDLRLEDAAGLRRLKHVEIQRRWLGPGGTLRPFSHVRRIVVTRWDAFEPSLIEAILAGLEATEDLSIRTRPSRPLPLIDHFASVPRLTRLSLTCPRTRWTMKASHRSGPVEEAAFPCHLFLRLESLELCVPPMHSRRPLLQPMPRLAELHLHVASMADVHPSWMCMLPGLRRLTLTLKVQNTLECNNVGVVAQAPAGVSPYGRTSERPGGGSLVSSRGSTFLENTSPCVGGGGRGGVSNTSSSSGGGGGSNSNRSSSSSGGATSGKVRWPHVRRLKLEISPLHRFQWEWLTMFPDLLVFQLAAEPASFPQIPPMGSPSLPRGLFEVHLKNKEHVSQLQKQQKNMDPHKCIRVLHLQE